VQVKTHFSSLEATRNAHADVVAKSAADLKDSMIEVRALQVA
jgi:hypothetical protein